MSILHRLRFSLVNQLHGVSKWSNRINSLRQFHLYHLPPSNVQRRGVHGATNKPKPWILRSENIGMSILYLILPTMGFGLLVLIDVYFWPPTIKAVDKNDDDHDKLITLGKELNLLKHKAVSMAYNIEASRSESDVPPLIEAVVTMSNGQARWTPLSSPDSFRLLEIQPGTEDIVTCSLKEYSLLDPPGYDAVSYCWTTTSGYGLVVVDGIPVRVHKSLHDALKAMRRLGECRVWIDGLCISQKDVEERSQQVQNIGRIFRSASLVSIFLGEEDEKTAGALPIVEHAVRSLTFSGKAEDLEVVLNLLERPWFERLWVIQEVCNAKQAIVIHGSSIIPWSHIVSLCQDFEELYARSPIPTFKVAENVVKVCTLDRMRQQFHNPNEGHFLLDLVMQASKFKVTDPRDKIFALVGLAKDVTSADWEVRPDYASSVEDVYHRFALWNLAKRGDLRLLSHTRDPDVPNKYSLPSWVPDLSQSDKLRTPEMLALSDEPVNPIQLVKPRRIYSTSFFNPTGTEDSSYTFQAPKSQWKCADGIMRPIRPGLKSWYMEKSDNDNPFGTRRIAFSGDNKIVHFSGLEVDELDHLSNPGFPEPSNDVARLILLLQSRYREWSHKDAWRLCHFIQGSLFHGSKWLVSCADIANRAYESQAQPSNPQLTMADFVMTLSCSRSLTGRPEPSVSENYSALLQHFNLESLNCPLSTANSLFNFGPSISTQTLHPSTLQTKHDALYQSLATNQTSRMTVQAYEQLLADSLSPDLPHVWRQIYPAIMYWSKARRFASTKQGRFANVPIGSRFGDIVCTVLGGSVPYVLRKRDDGYYTLIGECYVHGIMDGEAAVPVQRRIGDESTPRYVTKQFAIK